MRILLPVLAALPQPLALLDVGASAGLCLYPDRYTYRYGDHQIGAGDPVLECPRPEWRRPVACRGGLAGRPGPQPARRKPNPRTSRGSMPSPGPSISTAAPGYGPLLPSPPPTRPCSCAATW